MKRAILSDIHANLDALEAVLSDIRAQEVDQLICLGDLVGYGKQPVECVDRAKSFDVCLLGNHDLAALCDLDDGAFEDVDKGTAHWTREQIQQHPEHWSFLCQLPRTWQDGDLLMVHGSPRNPVHEYVFPEDIHNAHKMDRIFSLVPQYCFVGHTHLPGVILQQGEFLAPDSNAKLDRKSVV